MSPIELDRLLQRFAPDRREFMRTLLLGTAYAAPIIASFSMDSIGSPAMAASPNCQVIFEPALAPNTTDVAVAKSASGPAIAGTDLTYDLAVRNCSATPARNVSWQDVLPPNVTFVSATQTAGTAIFTLTKPAVGSRGGTLSGQVTAMPGNDFAHFDLVVRVDP